MATTAKTSTPADKPDGPPADKPDGLPAGRPDDATPTALVALPPVRYVVTYPRVGIMVGDDHVVVERGEYLDQRIPLELAKIKGPELLTFGMVAAVSTPQ